MNSAIIQDFVRRWGLAIASGSIGLFLLVSGAAGFASGFLLMPLVFIGGVPLFTDLQKGPMRPMFLLPINRTEMIRTWWGIGVVLSSLWLTLVTAVGLLFSEQSSLAGPLLSYRVFEAFGVYLCSLSLVYLGLLSSPSVSNGVPQVVSRKLVSTVIWFVGFMGLAQYLFKFQFLRLSIVNAREFESLPIHPAILVISGLFLAGIAYWKTDERLVSRAVSRGDVPSDRDVKWQPRWEFTGTLTGYPYFVMRSLLYSAKHCSLMIVAIGVMLFFLSASRSDGVQGIILGRSESPASFFLFFAIMPAYHFVAWLQPFKVFRQLPIPSMQLGSRLVLALAGILVLQSALLTIALELLTDASISLKFFSHFILLSGAACLEVPSILYFGMRSLASILPMVVIFPIVMAPLAFPTLNTPWISFLCAFILVFLACWLSGIVLGKTSGPYRPVAGEKAV